MDKEEFRVKLEEINNLVDKKDYEGALKVVDSIDWRRVKNVRTLCVVGEIYAVNKRYEDSREIFLLAYHRAPIGKNILTRLIEVSLKMQDVESAQDFFSEFVEIAPEDSNRYVLEYKILSAQNEPVEKKIPLLENYKKREFTEKWSYELARLYYQNGDTQKCVDLCNEIILWFSEGTYVTKAMELKAQLGMGNPALRPDLVSSEETEEEPSSAMQEDPAEHFSDDSPSIDSINVANEKEFAGVESLQERITKGIRDIFGNRKSAGEDDLSLNEPEEDEPEADSPSSDDENQDVRLYSLTGKEKTRVVGADSEKEEQSEPSVSQDQEKEEKPETEPEQKTEEQKVPEIEDENKVESAEETEPETKPVTESETEQETAPEAEPETRPETDAAAPLPEESSEEEKKGEDEGFNLESLILQQAEKQGIEIPEELAEPSGDQPETGRQEDSEAPVQETPESVSDSGEKDSGREKRKVPELEEEDFLTEEDMIQAEHEFYYGPGSLPESRLSGEEKKEEQEDKVFTEMLKESMEEEESADEEDKSSPVPAPAVPEKEILPEPVKPEAEPLENVLPEQPEVSEPVMQEEQKPQDDPDIIVPEVKEPVMIIPRKNRLTEEEIKLFAYFVKVPGMKEQLLDTLMDVQDAASDHTSKTGNIIVMGGKESGKTRLISSLIPAICRELNLTASKVAYVFAEDINDKDIGKVFEKLAGGFLVIEDANQLTARTVAMLEAAMEKETDGLIVIIEDEKIGMRKLIARHPRFAKKFTSMINIPIFTNDELVNFARVYTVESGYKIDQMGMLALYNKISENQKEDEPMSIGAVKILLDNAIAKAEGGILRFNRKKRMDKDGFVELHEKDFS